MKSLIVNTALCLVLLTSCKHEEKKPLEAYIAPVVTNNGTDITFKDTTEMRGFTTEKLLAGGLSATVTAPAKVAATVLPSDTGAAQNIILFDDTELAANYTQLLQHQANIKQEVVVNVKQKEIEYQRTQDLKLHGAATGQDVLNAKSSLSMEQTNLANEKSALIEHETKLKAAGFDMSVLKKAQSGVAYIICDVAENQIGNIKPGATCTLTFNSFPGETFNGKIDGIADAVDNATRMIKVRIKIANTDFRFKAGMFANVSFGIKENNIMSVNKFSLITVQGKSYVFVKKSPVVFERRPVVTSVQIGDRVTILSGLNSGDEVATGGVMQLKGLSFGY